MALAQLVHDGGQRLVLQETVIVQHQQVAHGVRLLQEEFALQGMDFLFQDVERIVVALLDVAVDQAPVEGRHGHFFIGRPCK
ncbi:hypothetical protein D3C72_1932390 [compost metagenome]